MITEDYVSFEIAKLLKEKGFNEPCEHYYAKEVSFGKDYIHLLYTDEPLHNSEIKGENINFLGWECTAPTLQMAMKWLREVHHLFISIDWYSDGCEASIYNTQTKTWEQRMLGNGHEYSYEEACEAAIKYCLENLI